ncbi:hypothetical protein COY43_02620 [Candidatus Berkelbacteria bacterium CG_4_10_14_0_8_um_filter_35_9_33_8]|nr:MAG: hypothetical protein COX10_01620 [Candidatus Berkelbacteria bacterium CG23_combo_of_CG06-09_8_20_14_all_33_15]PIZ28061.1 MAG: hypothetical protein COY43_02620 [Candidatus Berkelbacteria bacterium CG_4_10_14_0_8_um_filter_35_9_33_8]PJB51196.1 MAG: hypothetical protein CO100_02425 [Candidatus Berkelbacteria bacterium CG_4_9_14_3_um_filter_33_5]
MYNFFFTTAHAAILAGNPEKYGWQDIIVVIAKLIGEILKYAGILASIVILYAAFQYMTSAGDESKAGQAKQTLYWAIIGVAVITLSFLFVGFVGQLGGYQGIKR